MVFAELLTEHKKRGCNMTNLCYVYSYLIFSDDRTQRPSYFANSTPDVTDLILYVTINYKVHELLNNTAHLNMHGPLFQTSSSNIQFIESYN
jgi:hypothetical protein